MALGEPLFECTLVGCERAGVDCELTDDSSKSSSSSSSSVSFLFCGFVSDDGTIRSWKGTCFRPFVFFSRVDGKLLVDTCDKSVTHGISFVLYFSSCSPLIIELCNQSYSHIHPCIWLRRNESPTLTSFISQIAIDFVRNETATTDLVLDL